MATTNSHTPSVPSIPTTMAEAHAHTIVGIALDMTTTDAIELTEGISLTAGVLRDNLGIGSGISKENSELLYGALCLIAHAARTLSEYVGEPAMQRDGSHE